MEKFYSLSRAQKAIYKVDKLVGGSTCNICKSILFNKKYPVDEIKHGIINVFRINDALRIRIKDENGEPMQYFTEIYPNDIEVLYFNNKEELDAFGDKWAKEPINISGTLCEMKAVVLPDRSGGICKMHHVIGDIWSIALMGIQLSKMLAGKPFETYSFFDYLKKLEEYNRSKRHELDKAYYEEQFMKLGENIYFSDKHPSSFVAKRKTFEIGQETIDTLSKYAENNEATLFDIFVLTYSIYLSRIKMNAEKFNIGIALLNRSGAVERNTVGNFVNSVPFLVELENNKTFSENLTSIKTTVFKMFRHQKYCSDELAENLKSKYNFSGKFYDVLFSYVNVIFDDSIETTSYFQGEFHENLIINMDHLHVVGKSNVYYHYITEIFSESDINKIHYAMLSIIDDAIRNPDKKISELEIAPKEELSILHGDTANLPENSTIPTLFEETVAQKGDETCIVTDDKNYTFTEFNNLVKLIDLEIRKITHGKKQTIAVAAERSIEMYASIYAIVRGGNSYLPIDPAYPEGRIEYMLENSGTKLVLAQDKFCDLFNKIKVLNVSETIRSGAFPTENPAVSALPEDTAYIIYTSGSTGRPKGVKVSHRSLLNRILWMEKSYPLDENSVILQKTPFTFDVSLWEIFWWGISGGKMAFMKSGEHFLPEKIVEAVKRQGVTTIHFVPSVFDLFVSRLENNPSEREKVASLKDVFVSGEVLSASLINRFYAMFTAEKVKIHNLYGPTECAVDVTYYDCKSEETDPLPIGKPIDNTDIFILDSNMQAVPKGVTGEICVGGTNVGEGYVNNEGLTKEVFLKNPFGEGKIYKTGDLGYINSENEIIFSGRKDSQIKLNGQRVELSEIENAISEIEGITLAAVAARKNSEGSQILCAFYTGESKESGEIRQKLGSSLPGYMIPQIIMHLEEMPLTSSGKIDRQSLPVIDLDNIVSGKEFVEARTEEEKALVEAVKQVLKTDRVSVTDNFFELGGDSIQAIFVVSALHKAGFELSVADVAHNDTIETTALLLKRTSEDDGLSILRGEKTVLPESSTIPSLFEETVAQKGDEICIVTDDKNYTFAEFNNLVKLIDLEIRKITHGKKQTIAVAAERSIEMYASIYAIVRGGNSYLPIDPAYPEGRIEYMLENSGTKLVLAQDKFCDLFNKIKVLNVSETIRSGAFPTENPAVSALPEDTAYIIYTSGSTGRPKGVKVSHRSLLNRILWMEKSYPLDENSVILQKTPFTFDVSLWEIFWWGISGGKMAFMKSGEHFLPEKIVEAVKRQGVTTIHFVPSVFDLFVSRLENNPSEREKVASLKDVFVSGEVLSASLINRFYAMFTAEKVKIHNLYGPTECAVDVTYYDCKSEETDPLPIGKPIDNTDIFILDSNMQAVPKGVTGEICVGGTNVGEGYVNNEGLTKEVFLKNPFGEGKIYKTGDLGYINSENEIIFSGRKDSQIKLNGQRVELSEIENAISEIEGITLAAVAARKNSEGSQILCAFYTGESKESGEIRQKLGSSLPGYMIPQIIMHLEEMPLTSSGKIDRQSLPVIDLDNIVSGKEFVEARTEEEKALVEAVKQVLKTDRVSVTDNFFELGGDSIQAIFVVSALHKAGFELSVADVALHETISETALSMKPAYKKVSEKQMKSGIPFTPIMKVFSAEEQLKLEEFSQTQIIPVGKSGKEEIAAALNAIVSHHDILRAVVHENTLEIKGSDESKAYNLTVKDLRNEHDPDESINNDLKYKVVSFDLKNGPLVDAELYLTGSENILRITVQHFVIDAVSWRILADDLQTVLNQIAAGKEIKLPQKTASFKTWVENLEYYKNGEDAGKEKSFWLNTLDLLNNTANLVRRGSQMREPRKYVFGFDETFTRQLVSDAGKAFGTHADELLLSALGLAVQEVSGNSTAGICVESHGREQLHGNLDVGRTVGWFTSYFPVAFESKETLGDFIVNTKEIMRHIPKKGIGYTLLFGGIPEKTDIVYNFFGTVKGSDKYIFSTLTPETIRNNLPDRIFINTVILNGRFYAVLSAYIDRMSGIVEKLGKAYEEKIREIADYCVEYKGNVKTVSDYSDSGLKKSELEDFERMFEAGENE